MKKSNFRLWVENIWRENCRECSAWSDIELPLDVYFNRYKWWLKREYRHQLNNEYIQKD
jgi:hypothetical protein